MGIPFPGEGRSRQHTRPCSAQVVPSPGKDARTDEERQSKYGLIVDRRDRLLAMRKYEINRCVGLKLAGVLSSEIAPTKKAFSRLICTVDDVNSPRGELLSIDVGGTSKRACSFFYTDFEMGMETPRWNRPK